MIEKFEKGQSVWYYCSGHSEPIPCIYNHLIYDWGWNDGKLLPVSGPWHSSPDDFLYATELEAWVAKAKWLKGRLEELDAIIAEADAKKIKAEKNLRAVIHTVDCKSTVNV